MIVIGENLPMDKLIMKELKATYILSSRNVLDLKKYISFKYADLSAKEKANILADAIRKTIDERIPKVEKSLKSCLIDNIIKTSVNQGSFDINSEDVFIECLNLKCDENEELFLSELCSWLNKLTVNNIEKENMKKFIQSIYSLDMKTYNAESISTVLENSLQEHDSNNTDNDISSHISNNILSDISNDNLHDNSNDNSNDISNDISNDNSNDILSDNSNNNSNNNSKKHFESKHLSPETEISPDYQLTIKETEKSQFGLVLNKLIEKNHGIIHFRRDNKIFSLKSIALVMSLLFVFLVKTNTIGNIIGIDTNNYKNEQQQIILNTINLKNFQRSTEETKIESPSTENFRMKATAYDLSVECCGKPRNHPLYGITSSGTRAAIRRTVAVDPSVIPLGSRLYIKFPKSYSSLDGIYVAEDTGSKVKGNIIDIFLGEDKLGESIVHKKADNFGVQMVEVSLLKSFEKK